MFIFFQLFSRDFKAWEAFCNNSEFNRSSSICEIHFESRIFRNNANRSQGLIPYAVPTLHGPMEDSSRQQYVSLESEVDVCSSTDVHHHHCSDGASALTPFLSELIEGTNK